MLQTTSVNNKRIAKNTLLLYLRTAVNIIIGLYTSRVILDTLGVTDYGIYSVVAGVVALSSFFTSSMSSATTRQITYALGKNDRAQLLRIFSCCNAIHYGIALIVLLLSETIGLWFLNTCMVFPIERMVAVNLVYQFSVFTALLTVIITPFNASIIAHEDFRFSAYAGITQTVANLVAVFVLLLLPKKVDYLIVYTFFCMAIQAAYNLWVYSFAHRKYKFSAGFGIGKKADYKKILSFSGWTIFGSCANVGYQQGVNILFNILLNLSVNAAMGIANQINGKINILVMNFQQAFNPQLTKSYAVGDLTGVHNLIFKSAKFSFIVLFVFAMPLMLNIDFVLSAWLGEYPKYTDSLSCLILIGSLIEALSGPLWITLYATGRIKFYQMGISFILLLSLPLTYLLLRLDYDANSAIVVRIVLFLAGLIFRLILLRKYIGLSLRKFVSTVILPVVTVVIVSLPMILIRIENNVFFQLCLIAGEFLVICILSFFVALKRSERSFIISAIKRQIYK